MVAIVAIVVIESAAVHFAVAARHPRTAWVLTLTSLVAVIWVIRDYLALSKGRVRLTTEAVRLTIGRRFDITIPLGAITGALKPTFRDLPTPGTKEGRDFLNLTKPAAPNVLLLLDGPRRVRLMAGIHRQVRHIVLKLDDPAAFLEAIDERRTAPSPRPA